MEHLERQQMSGISPFHFKALGFAAGLIKIMRLLPCSNLTAGKIPAVFTDDLAKLGDFVGYQRGMPLPLLSTMKSP